ncbi:MAG TPA: hypothetical protein VK169_05225 [Saprospiraceae bacterium]|nr:hypothetical protein [Saprospiraceae bacterium]
MKNFIKLTLSLFIIFIYSCGVKSIPLEERVNVQYYASQEDYKNKKLSEMAYTSIKEKGKDYITIHNVFGLDDQKIKEANMAFAIIIDDQIYFDMRYSIELNNPEVFAKFNIVGTISALFIDDNTSDKIKNGGVNYGGGLVDVLMSDLNNWKDAKYKEHKILVFNLDKFVDTNMDGRVFVQYKFLSRGNFNKVLGTQLSDSEIYNLTFEKVKEIIIELNTKGE